MTIHVMILIERYVSGIEREHATYFRTDLKSLFRHSHDKDNFDRQPKERERSKRPTSIGREVLGQNKDSHSRSIFKEDGGRVGGRRGRWEGQERRRREEREGKAAGQTGRHGQRHRNWEQDGYENIEQTTLEKSILNQENSRANSYTPEYNTIDDNTVESGDGGFYHGVGDNFRKEIGNLADPTSPYHHRPATSPNRDFLEEDNEATIIKLQSWDFLGRPENHELQGSFGHRIIKRKQPYVKEISHSDSSGHGAYMEEFDPSPKQGIGGFDPLFRPSTKDPRPTASYNGRSTMLQQEGSRGLSGIETPSHPGDLPPKPSTSTGGGIDWGSWGPETTFESVPEFVDQLNGQKGSTNDYDYPAFDVDSGYKVQAIDPGEDFGNEIYYEKDLSSNSRGLQDRVPYFDFDEFHRSAGFWH